MMTLLGDICTITSSKRIFASDYVESGIPFFRSKEVIESYNGAQISSPLYISQDKFEEIKAKFGVPKEADILLTSVGTIGIPYQVKEGETFYFKDGNLTWLKDFSNKVNPQYLYYYISNPFCYTYLNILSIGSSQSALTIQKLKKVELDLPSLGVQNRIAKTLSTYDEMIGVNRKRIAILEEMAMRTYHEWFVHFRFPGHETTTFVDGLPKGWERSTIQSLGRFKRGKNITVDEAVEGPYPVIAGGKTPSCFHNTYNTVAPVITVSASGANAGYTHLYHENIWAADCSFMDSQVSNIYFVYCTLRTNQAITDNLQIGSAQPHVYAKDLNKIKCILPPQYLLDQFEQFAKDVFVSIHKLEKQNAKLQQMRDRLLPQLMSGKLNVNP